MGKIESQQATPVQLDPAQFTPCCGHAHRAFYVKEPVSIWTWEPVSQTKIGEITVCSWCHKRLSALRTEKTAPPEFTGQVWAWMQRSFGGAGELDVEWEDGKLVPHSESKETKRRVEAAGSYEGAHYAVIKRFMEPKRVPPPQKPKNVTLAQLQAVASKPVGQDLASETPEAPEFPIGDGQEDPPAEFSEAPF